MENIRNFPVVENQAEEGSSASFNTGDTIEMRELRASELMLVVRIIGKIGIKEFSALVEDDGVKNAIIAAMAQGEGDQDFASIGMTVIFSLADTITRNLPRAEKEIYQLLGNLTNKTPQEISDLRADIFFDLILQLVTKEEFKRFFTVAQRYIR